MKTEHATDKAQEWTGQMVWEMLGNPCESLLACERLAESINAAVTAEKDWSEHLRIQLEAEVEKVNKLQNQFADERENFRAAQRLLVDALERLREFRRMNITPVEDIAADALAKVKEGNDFTRSSGNR